MHDLYRDQQELPVVERCIPPVDPDFGVSLPHEENLGDLCVSVRGNHPIVKSCPVPDALAMHRVGEASGLTEEIEEGDVWTLGHA